MIESFNFLIFENMEKQNEGIIVFNINGPVGGPRLTDW